MSPSPYSHRFRWFLFRRVSLFLLQNSGCHECASDSDCRKARIDAEQSIKDNPVKMGTIRQKLEAELSAKAARKRAKKDAKKAKKEAKKVWRN